MEPVHMQMVQKDGEAATYVPARRKSKFDLIPARYIMAILSSIGLAIVYGLKVNLSVAIVAMINHTALAQSHADDHGKHMGLNLSNGHYEPKGEECSQGNSTDNTAVDGPFVWSEPIQGLVLGSYFWGYLLTQFPGGRISELFSAKWVMWGAVVVNVVFTLLTPVAAYLSYIAVLVVRVFEGFGGGVTLPAMHVMIARWTPPEERSRISAIVYAGTALGTVISMTLAGVLAGQLGWEAVFYVMGGLASIWCILWIVFVYDSPELHPRITEEEKTYIVTSLGGGHDHKKAMPVPWKAVFTSLPFYAIMVAHMLGNFGWYMLLIELPTYMNHVLKFNIQENSGLSSVPFLCMWLFSIVASNRLDWASSNKYITTTVARKLATATASIIPGICLVAVSFVGCDRVLAVLFMTIAVMCIGAMFSGYLSNHIDIAPNYAGTLMAITNTVATIPGFVVPVFVGELTHGNQTVGQWQIIFCTTAALFGIEAIFYTIFGSGQEQPWNKAQERGTEEENTKM